MNDLAILFDYSEDAFWIGFLCFLRIGAAMALLPAFGEAHVSPRLRLGLGLAFTVIVAPAVGPALRTAQAVPDAFPALWATEPLVGLAFGLSLRLTVIALQTAGTIAAQSTSLSQVFASAGAEPMPVVGQILVMGGLALAVTLGLHVALAESLVGSYDLFLPGSLPPSDQMLAWVVERISGSFSLGVQLAMPFVIAALIYNVALGVINRAMPQLMVAMVGAPALTLGGMVLMILCLPAMLGVWIGHLGRILAQPF